jgi:hypothetical protein
MDGANHASVQTGAAINAGVRSLLFFALAALLGRTQRRELMTTVARRASE